MTGEGEFDPVGGFVAAGSVVALGFLTGLGPWWQASLGLVGAGLAIRRRRLRWLFAPASVAGAKNSVLVAGLGALLAAMYWEARRDQWWAAPSSLGPVFCVCSAVWCLGWLTAAQQEDRPQWRAPSGALLAVGMTAANLGITELYLVWLGKTLRAPDPIRTFFCLTLWCALVVLVEGLLFVLWTRVAMRQYRWGESYGSAVFPFPVAAAGLGGLAVLHANWVMLAASVAAV